MNASMLRWLLLAPLVSTAGFAAAQGNVLIVGPGGFSQIQDAVVAASDGDTILVKSHPPGSGYLPVDIAGKALTIVTDVAGTPIVQNLSVHDVPEGKTVVLSKLRFVEVFPLPGPVLLQNNAGDVRLVGCTSRSASTYSTAPAMRLASSTGSTALAACTLTGADGIYEADGFPGGTGLSMEDARAAVFDSTVRGGDGGYSWVGFCGEGGAGASVVSAGAPAKLLLSNSTVQGGNGGDRFTCSYGLPGGDGAPGLVVGPGATVTHQQCTLAGGTGGVTTPCMNNGADAPAIDNSGVVLSVPTSAVELTTPTVAREGQTVTFTVRGVPGDRVILLTGSQTTWRERPDGVLLVLPGKFAHFPRPGPIGTIGPTGVLTTDVTMTMLPPGMQATNLWVQALARHPDGTRTLGSFSVITVLDSAF